jgi:hypothetical protein
MSTVETQNNRLPQEQDRLRTSTTSSAWPMAAAAGGGAAEALCGLAVIALSIAGLAHAYPALLAAIAVIVFGAGLLCADGAVGTYFSRFSARRGFFAAPAPVVSGGLGAEAVAGIAGIVLGILALVDVAPVVLIAVAVLAFGASVIMGGASRARVAMRTVTRFGWTEEESAALHEAHTAALGGRALIGLAAVVLGILGIVFVATFPMSSLVLSLVALLCLGSGAVLTGSAFGGQAVMNR